MKNLLLPILLGCAALLPVSRSQAADTTFGDFTVGQTFTLTVTERTIIRTKGFSSKEIKTVPDGVPKFEVGDHVKFTIGGEGQLKGAGFKITYRSDRGRYNLYANRPTLLSAKGSAATVYKTLQNKPVRAGMSFDRLTFSGIVPVTTTVDYVFKK